MKDNGFITAFLVFPDLNRFRGQMLKTEWLGPAETVRVFTDSLCVIGARKNGTKVAGEAAVFDDEWVAREFQNACTPGPIPKHAV